jgi:hypothetical protein
MLKAWQLASNQAIQELRSNPVSSLKVRLDSPKNAANSVLVSSRIGGTTISLSFMLSTNRRIAVRAFRGASELIAVRRNRSSLGSASQRVTVLDRGTAAAL